MKKHPFDKKLKKELVDYDSPVDIKGLWSAIEVDVDQVNKNRKKEKRRFFFFWLFAGVGLMGLVALGFNSFSSKELAIIPQNKTVQKTESTTTAPLSPTSKKEKNTTPVEASKSQTVETNNASSSSSKKSLSKPLSIPEKKKQTFFIPTQKSETTSSKIKKSNGLLNSKKEKNPQAIKRQKAIPLSQKSSILESKKTPTEIQYLTTIPLGTMETIPLKLLSIDYINLSDIPKNETEEERRKKKASLQFSLGAEVGIGFTNRTLENFQEPNNTYLQRRLEAENPQENSSLGLNAEIIHRSGLSLSIGTQYTKVTEKLFIDQAYTVFDTIQNGLYGLRINPYGDTIAIYQEIINSKTTTSIQTYYNRYQWFQVPVLLGYHWQASDWSIGLRGGLIANFKLLSSGKILAEDDIQLLDLKEKVIPSFSNALSLSYQLGGTVRYQLKEHWQISVNPFFTASPKFSSTTSNSPIQQSYRLFGIRMGSRFVF